MTATLHDAIKAHLADQTPHAAAFEPDTLLEALSRQVDLWHANGSVGVWPPDELARVTAYTNRKRLAHEETSA